MCTHPNPLYRTGLEIAGISIAIESFVEWKDVTAFEPFVKTSEKPDFKVIFRLSETLPEIPEAVLHEDCCYRVHPDGKDGYLRSFFDAPRDMTPYAIAAYDYPRGIVRIDCLAKGTHCVSELHNGFFHIGFEAMLVHKQRLCIHAACVDTHLGGIVFSGPSGIGKSTQAKLWCEQTGAKMINGDRPILSREDTGWLAWGSPYAGSSRCHVNENCPVTAIVILEQAKACDLQRLSPAEAFRAIWPGLTVHNWDRWMVEEASSLTMELIGTVPVFRFACTLDDNAVAYLEQELRKECCL